MKLARSRVIFQIGISLLSLVIVSLLILGYWQGSVFQPEKPHLPDQRQGAKRLQEISALDIQRSGRVKIDVFRFGSPLSGEPARVRYSLQAPGAVVEDTEIRGFLDGTTKYLFNQGTAYHIRVGRRYNGPYESQFELKRSLIRWTLPQLPKSAQIVSAQVTLWIESYLTDSPLSKQNRFSPLHLYLYPIHADWGPGDGGIQKDSFSVAAPGEASWTEARAGESRWPAAGGLEPDLENPERRYVTEPLAVTTIKQSNRRVTFSSERLLNYLQQSLNAGKTFDLLLKLDDQEEDRRGTETAILTSNFGDDNDISSKRPRLDVEIVFESSSVSLEREFVLENGMEYVLPVLEHPGTSVVIAAAITSQDDGIPPEIWVRGGNTGDTPQIDWMPYHHPRYVDWDWTQIKLSAAHHRLDLGEVFVIELLEPWVRPGPRQDQLPEMILIAPSGALHRIEGHSAPELSYRIEFQPDELGFWRYGWSFLPMSVSPRGSHQGEGIFFVDMPTDDSEAAILEQWASRLIGSLQVGKWSDATLQWQINTLIRRASVFAQKGRPEKALGERLIGNLKQAIADSRQPQSDQSFLKRLKRHLRGLL